MGFNVTTQSGVQVYKMIITLLPLIPILVLLVQNALYVNNLLTQQSSISYTESQVTTFECIANKFNKFIEELIFRNIQYILSMDIIGNRCCKFSSIRLQVTKRETCFDLCKFFVSSKVLHHRWKKVLSFKQLLYRYVRRKL